MFLNRRADDVDVRFEARADAVVRLAVTGAAVEREVLREQVQDGAIVFQANLFAALYCISHILKGDGTGPSKFIDPAAVVPIDGNAADSHHHGIDDDARFGFGLTHRVLDRSSEGLLIGEAALVPTGGGHFAVAEISEAPFFHRQDDAARESAASVQSDGELRFLGH